MENGSYCKQMGFTVKFLGTGGLSMRVNTADIWLIRSCNYSGEY